MSTSFSLELLKDIYIVFIFGLLNQLLAIALGYLFFNDYFFSAISFLNGKCNVFLRAILRKLQNSQRDEQEYNRHTTNTTTNFSKLRKVDKDVLISSLFCHNSVSLPVVYLSALCYLSSINGSQPFFKLTSEESYKKAITAISIFIIPAEILFYTLGSYLYKKGGENLLLEEKKKENFVTNNNIVTTAIDKEVTNEVELCENVTLSSSYENTSDLLSPTYSLQNEQMKLLENELNTLQNNSDNKSQNESLSPMSPSQNNIDNNFTTQINISLDKHLSQESLDELESQQNLQNSVTTTTNPSNYFTKVTTFCKKLFIPLFHFILHDLILNPPLSAIFLALLISSINQNVKNFLIINPPAFISTIKQFCTIFGQGVAPVAMLILGGNLAIMEMEKESEKKGENIVSDNVSLQNSLQQNNLKYKLKNNFKKIIFKIIKFLKMIKRLFTVKYLNRFGLFLSILIKLILFPLLGIFTIYLFKFILPFTIPNDPILFLVSFIQFSTPTAIAVSALASVNNNYGLEETCELLLWHYLIAPITLSLLSPLYLILSCDMLINENVKNEICLNSSLFFGGNNSTTF
ncbi:hypothetical protein ABK040_011573 [Willaertia magna]